MSVRRHSQIETFQDVMGQGEQTFLAHWHVSTVDDRQNWEEVELAVVGSLNGLNRPIIRSAVELRVDAAQGGGELEINCRVCSYVTSQGTFGKRGDDRPDSEARDCQESEGRDRTKV